MRVQVKMKERERELQFSKHSLKRFVADIRNDTLS